MSNGRQFPKAQHPFLKCQVDFSLLPAGWPDDAGQSGGSPHHASQREGKRGKKGGGSSRAANPRDHAFLAWLRAQPERRVAVVTHHNFITSLVGGHRVENAEPIECVLGEAGIRVANPGDCLGLLESGQKAREGGREEASEGGGGGGGGGGVMDGGRVRISFVGRPDQRKAADNVVLVEAVESEVAAAALAKVQGLRARLSGSHRGGKKGKHGGSGASVGASGGALGGGEPAGGGAGGRAGGGQGGKLLVRRVSDGRETVLSPTSPGRIDWIENGDVL